MVSFLHHGVYCVLQLSRSFWIICIWDLPGACHCPQWHIQENVGGHAPSSPMGKSYQM